MAMLIESIILALCSSLMKKSIMEISSAIKENLFFSFIFYFFILKKILSITKVNNIIKVIEVKFFDTNSPFVNTNNTATNRII